MNLLALIPGRDWLYICALMVLLGGGIGFVRHEREIGAVRVEAVRQAEHARAAAVAASAIEANQAETNRRIAASKETVRVTIQSAAAVAADASAVAGQLDGLRNDLAAARRSAAASHPAASGGGPTTSDAVVVLSDLLERAGDRAAGLAKLADKRGLAGSACERSYDSLTPGH